MFTLAGSGVPLRVMRVVTLLDADTAHHLGRTHDKSTVTWSRSLQAAGRTRSNLSTQLHKHMKRYELGMLLQALEKTPMTLEIDDSIELYMYTHIRKEEGTKQLRQDRIKCLKEAAFCINEHVDDFNECEARVVNTTGDPVCLLNCCMHTQQYLGVYHAEIATTAWNLPIPSTRIMG